MKRPRLDLNGVEWQRHCWGRRQDAARARVHANCLLTRMYRVLNGRGQADSLPARARFARPCRLCRSPRRGVILPFVRTTSTKTSAP